MIELSKIKIDGGTQSRDQLNEDVVAEYAEAMKAGVKFPAVTVFYDGSSYWLADGFHRYFAAKKAGIPKINEEVTPGTLQDAQLFSYSVNANHGLRRSNADKRKAVTGTLNHPASSNWSDNQIAKHCGVSATTVGTVRASLSNLESEKQADRTYTTKHGTTATMKTENIGKSKKPALAVVPQEPEYNPADDEAAEKDETIRTLSDERDALLARVAAEVMPVSEEEKTAALTTMDAQRAEIKRLEIELRAVTASRDRYQRDNGELKKQCAMYRKQLEKMQKAAA